MNKIMIFGTALTFSALSTSCGSNPTSTRHMSNSALVEQAIPYKEANNYFIKNDVKESVPTKITAKEELEKYFGMATTMGPNGQPTQIDFSKEYAVIADFKATDKETTLKPISLTKSGNDLILDYSITEGKNVNFTTRPFLLLIVPDTAQGNVVLKPHNMEPKGHGAQVALDWDGTYEGVLPCADCEGIKTTVVLNKDDSYKINSEYMGKKGAAPSSNSGKLEWDSTGNVIVIAAGSESLTKFQVEEGSLKMLDQDGKEITGDLAEKYILRKK
ncbi:MAG: copper resistance protein NlpE [Chitinophagaceae bacterium]